MKKWPDWLFLLVVTAITGALSARLLLWVHSFGDGETVTAASDEPARPGAHGRDPGAAGSDPAVPSRLVIPSIGANAPVIPEGSRGPDGGALDVPASVHVIGWWDGQWRSPDGLVRERVARPGDPGVALLAGHVDSAVQGHGALYRLSRVKAGDPVNVYDEAGGVTRWKVTRLQVVSKDALPAALFTGSGPSRLAIVSCGGRFDAATGHYADNIIAWADSA